MNDDDLRTAFESQSLSMEQWTHRAHVRMAWIYVDAVGRRRALERLRTGIRALNVAIGVQNTESSGYHESLTVTWVALVASTITHHGRQTSSDAFCDANPHLLTRTAVRIFYTRKRLLSPEARATFVEPDLTPLPG